MKIFRNFVLNSDNTEIKDTHENSLDSLLSNRLSELLDMSIGFMTDEVSFDYAHVSGNDLYFGKEIDSPFDMRFGIAPRSDTVYFGVGLYTGIQTECKFHYMFNVTLVDKVLVCKPIPQIYVTKKMFKEIELLCPRLLNFLNDTKLRFGKKFFQEYALHAYKNWFRNKVESECVL